MSRGGGLSVRFVRGESRRYRSVMLRADGLEVELEGGSYNRAGGSSAPSRRARLGSMASYWRAIGVRQAS